MLSEERAKKQRPSVYNTHLYRQMVYRRRDLFHL